MFSRGEHWNYVGFIDLPFWLYLIELFKILEFCFGLFFLENTVVQALCFGTIIFNVAFFRFFNKISFGIQMSFTLFFLLFFFKI